jgi:hypothetical protein
MISTQLGRAPEVGCQSWNRIQGQARWDNPNAQIKRDQQSIRACVYNRSSCRKSTGLCVSVGGVTNRLYYRCSSSSFRSQWGFARRHVGSRWDFVSRVKCASDDKHTSEEWNEALRMCAEILKVGILVSDFFRSLALESFSRSLS